DPPLSVPKAGLKLDIALVRLGVVRGMVRDITGRAVAGADVSVNGVDFDSQEGTRTDSQGRFEIHNLSIPPRKDSQLYAVNVTHPRLSFSETQVPLKPRYENGDEANVRLTMKPRAVISGRLSFRGKPLKEGHVVVLERQGGYIWEEDLTAFVDKNGRYRLKVSAPARYKIAFHGEDVVSQQATVDVMPGRGVALNREFKPFPYGSIRGRIVDLAGRGVKGADIELWTESTSETMPVATTDAQGRFFVAKVAPYDKYDVSVTLPRADMRGRVRIEPVRVRSYRTTFVSARADTVPPKFQVLSAVPKVLKAGIVSFRLRASDNQGLSSAGLKVDGESAVVDRQTGSTDFEDGHKRAPRRAEATLRWDARTVSNGMHKLDFVVWDLVGNATTRSFKVRVEGSPFKPKPTPAPSYSPNAGSGAGY
ncbi:MAG: carboxypeptidase-like regulatory domain-containing protein, partial [Armatimonadetes bacterium]|nr:carboxypeptidase-like regulatory domain-containing protein [Armatimonadota bacterium]